MLGRFVVFEGMDGAGKTSQIDLAQRWFMLRDVEVERHREPGTTKIGERIRDMLLDKKTGGMTMETKMLLFFASRVQLVEEKILPALEQGRTVLLDRYYYSTAAYQGPWLRGGVSWVLRFAQDLRLPEPDLIVYLDGDPEILAKRKAPGQDRIEAKGVEYQKAVRNAYHEVAKARAMNFKIVDAARPVGEVHEDIVRLLSGEVK